MGQFLEHEPSSVAYSLEDALESPDEVRALVLESVALDELPASIARLRQLRSLFVRGSRLRTLPDSIGELEHLEELILGRNLLHALPESVTRLPALRMLVLSENRLRRVPDLSKLARLVHLDLSNNPLEALPRGLEHLRALEVAVVSSVAIGHFPEELVDLPRLSTLDLWASDVRSVPPSISRTRNLSELILASNGLTTLPDELGELARLTRLSVGNNELTRLPETLAKLESLEVLDVRGNHLTGISPMLFRRLSSLRELHLIRNPLRELPAEISRLRRLEVLSLCGCGLAELGDEIGTMFNLTALALDDNPLGRLPPSVLALDRLEWLYARRIGLTELPVSIRLLRNLRMLYVNGNALTSLGTNLADLGQLASIDARDNRITSVGSVPAATELLLRNNPASDAALAIDRTWSLDALREATANACGSPRVHDPRLDGAVVRLERELSTFGVVLPARPTNGILGDCLARFERGLEEGPPLGFGIALLSASYESPVADHWRPMRRDRRAFLELAWCLWATVLRLEAEDRELVGRILNSLVLGTLPRFALGDALNLLVPSARETPIALTAHECAERTMRCLRIRNEPVSFDRAINASDVEPALEGALVAAATHEPGRAAELRTLASLLAARDVSRKHEHLKAALTADPTYPDAAIRLAKMAWGSPVILDQRPASSPDAIRKLLDIAEAREYTLPEWSGSKDDIAQMREALKQFEKS